MKIVVVVVIVEVLLLLVCPIWNLEINKRQQFASDGSPLRPLSINHRLVRTKTRHQSQGTQNSLDIALKFEFVLTIYSHLLKVCHKMAITNIYFYYVSKRIELRFVLLLLLLLLLRGKFAHFFQIAITQPIFELGPSDFAW